MSRKPPFEWTDELDLALKIMQENGFTPSGIAYVLGCSRLEAIERAVVLGITIRAVPNSKLAAEIAQAATRARYRHASQDGGRA